MPTRPRCRDNYTQLAAGFGVGIATVYRYVAETVAMLAALAPDLAAATRTAACKAFVILDGRSTDDGDAMRVPPCVARAQRADTGDRFSDHIGRQAGEALAQDDC